MEECLEMMRVRSREEVHRNSTFGYSVRVPQGWVLTRHGDEVWELGSEDGLGLLVIFGKSNLDLSLDEFHSQHAIPILNEYSSRNNNGGVLRGPLPMTIAGRSSLYTIADQDSSCNEEKAIGVRSVASATSRLVVLSAFPCAATPVRYEYWYIRDTFFDSLR